MTADETAEQLERDLGRKKKEAKAEVLVVKEGEKGGREDPEKRNCTPEKIARSSKGPQGPVEFLGPSISDTQTKNSSTDWSWGERTPVS